jgi:hypothetical protein
MHQRLEVGENEKEEDVHRKLDAELSVSSWRVPGSVRPKDTPPRVTEDGLKIPSWWTDDETESQRMLAGQGMVL